MGTVRPTDARDIRWGVLGGPWVAADGVPLELGRQARFVLGLLLRHPGRPVPVERLSPRADAPDATDKAVAAGRMAASRLRSQLAAIGTDTSISTAPGGYVIDVDPLSVDHVAFAQSVREAEAIEWPNAALRRLEGALELWRGEPFAPWASDETFHVDAAALDELHRAVIDNWGELALRSGRHRSSLDQLQAAVSEEPLRERRWASLILAQYRCGNQSQALRDYERARTVLREEVGLEPGPELRRLASRVLEHDASLDWRPARAVVRSTALGSLTRTSVLLGREREVDDVLALIERHRVVTVSGLGGVGKSSLALEVARRTDRPVWVAPLAGVDREDRVARSVATALGLTLDLPEAGLAAAIADHLDSVGGLCVLDNCEHVLAAAGELVDAIVSAAPAARVLATSRVELTIEGAVAYPLDPLPTGTAAQPGAAAFIAADFAMIRPSELRDRWGEVAAICRQADGIPLALELLGASAAAGTLELERASRAVEGAVATALRSLPEEARDVVTVLAALPADIGAPLLADITGRDTSSTRRAVGYATRAGLVVQRSVNGVGRVRVLEPARDVIAAGTASDARLVRALQHAVLELARAARPSLAAPILQADAVRLDDEHESVIWLMEQLEPIGQLEVLCAVGSLWRAFGRTAEGLAWCGRLRDVAAGAEPLTAARFCVVRAQMTPSLTSRAAIVDELRSAMDVAEAADDVDLALRAGAELSIGLALSGDLPDADRLLRDLEQRVPDDAAWAAVTVRSLLAMRRALTGDLVGAADDLAQLATRYTDVGGSTGDALSNLFLAATFAQAAGDDGLVRHLLAMSDAYPMDRFSTFARLARVHEGTTRTARRRRRRGTVALGRARPAQHRRRASARASVPARSRTLATATRRCRWPRRRRARGADAGVPRPERRGRRGRAADHRDRADQPRVGRRLGHGVARAAHRARGTAALRPRAGRGRQRAAARGWRARLAAECWRARRGAARHRTVRDRWAHSGRVTIVTLF